MDKYRLIIIACVVIAFSACVSCQKSSKYNQQVSSQDPAALNTSSKIIASEDTNDRSSVYDETTEPVTACPALKAVAPCQRFPAL